MSKSIVFIDSGIANYNTAITGLEPGAKWVLLDAEQDGLLQMRRALAGYSDLDAIHVVSHGGPGVIHLGSTVLDAGNLNLFLAPLRAIGQALNEKGDLLLYGCDVAAGAIGQNFVNALASATGADVAASDNLTGAAALGGDNVLEQTVGVIEALTLPLGDSIGVLAANTTPTFSTSGGKIITVFGSSGGAGDVTVQTDGKILVAGYSNSASPGTSDFALIRYNANGSLDTTFGSDGKLTTSFGGALDSGVSIAVQADGKILVAGATGAGTTYDFALARYNVNGSLDTTFDTDGKVTTDFGSTEFGGGVTVQADGKILVAGHRGIFPISDLVLARYNANGSLDKTFDTDGKLTADFSSSGRGITVQADGKILVPGAGGGDFVLARYNADGSLDTTFDTDGKVTTDFGGSDEDGCSVAVQADGKILVAGTSGSGVYSNFALARYNTNGSLDTTFDTDGKLTTDFGSLNGLGEGVTVQADGKILVAGCRTSNAYDNELGRYESDFALVRYNTNGSLDTTFDTDGKVTTDFGGYDDGSSLTVQADGKILVAGTSMNRNFDIHFALARYNSNGSLDTTYIPAESTIGVINGTINNDTLTGQGGGDVINALAGNDTLDGGAGSDTLIGGAGNDTYIVDNAGDKVFETTTATSTTDAGGTDLVKSGVSFTLGNYIENLTLTGTVNINGTGNTLANTLTGNAGANTLDGGTGQDTLIGGAGNDTYIVDNVGDKVFETTTATSTTDAGGTDLVKSSVSFTLGNYIENLTLTGTANINGAGNTLANTLTGNAGANTLDGGTGQDTLIGGAGNDTYIADNVGDKVFETTTATSTADAGGTDLVKSSVSFTLGNYIENLTLTGTANINGTGNTLANTLTGNAGANTLDGGTGQDTLTGRAGNDIFYFKATTDTGRTSTTSDVITDFVHGQDKIDLSAIDANATTTASNDAFIFIGAAAFSSTNAAGQLRYVYDAATATVMVYGSTNADSSAEFAIKLTGMSSVALTASDFVL